MTDGKTYTVTFTAQDEAKTQSSAKFTATDGTIADFALSTTSITANKATTIKYSALDAKSIVIYEKEITDKPSGIDIDVTCDNGYVDGAKLVLINAGNTAKVVVTYHTYKYDTEGNETGVIKKEFTITAVDASATVSNFGYTVVGATTDTPAWENLTANTKLSMSDSTKYVKFQIKDSNNENVTSSCGYTVESSNNNILLASGDVATYATVVPVAEGTAYLILKDGSKTITTLPITVVAKRVIGSFTLDKASVSIATSAAAATTGVPAAPGTTFISYSVKDQYGDTMSGATIDEITCVSKPSTTATTPTVTDNGTGKLLISTDSADKGTYTYKVVAKAGDKTQTKSFSVNVVSPSGNTDYVLQFVGTSDSAEGTNAISSMDATVNKDNTGSKTISVNIAKRQSGVIVGGLDLSTVTVSAISVIGSDGKTYAKSGSTSCAAITNTELTNALGATDSDGKLFNVNVVDALAETMNTNPLVVKNLAAGAYTVKVDLKENVSGKEVTRTVTGTFKITDSQPTLTANVLATNCTNKANLESVFEDKDFVKYVYGGVTQADNDVQFVEVDGDSKKNGKNYVVKKVTVAVPVPGASTLTYVKMTVPVNRVFTNSVDW